MSTIKEGQRRGGIGAADNVLPIGETKRGASVPHSLDALGVWALSLLDCDRVPRIMLSSNLMILWATAAARSALARRRVIENLSGFFLSSRTSVLSCTCLYFCFVLGGR